MTKVLSAITVLLVQKVKGERFAALDGGVKVDRDRDQPEADGALPHWSRHWSQPARCRNSRSSPESFGDGLTPPPRPRPPPSSRPRVVPAPPPSPRSLPS